MIIQKQYKFYAAHRNEMLLDKCRNLHGHRYGVRCFFEVERDGHISTLFGDFDALVEPWLKENYDHGMLINKHDPLYETLQHHMQRTGETLRLNVFDGPTSVENLCHKLFTEITQLGLRLERLEVAETDTSVVSYSREDWVADNRYFQRLQATGRPTEAPSDSCLCSPVA
ncbi:MAG: 6-carboxytetrahydropterin synthase [Planctomyces sp.]|nr:6-carboxytetrahydropterin synthase [Planctomyces sp.]